MMNETTIIDIDTLMAPLSGENPAGEDMGFSAEYDAIKEARRADDPNLPQGDWQQKLKVAEWPKTRDLTLDVLTAKSKDLQIACWLTEALAHLNGFQGVSTGLEIIRRLLVEYWESLYPEMEDDDLEERASKLAWLNDNLPSVIHEISLTSLAAGGYGWDRWNEAKMLDNLALKNPDAARTMVRDFMGRDPDPEALLVRSGLVA